MKIIIDIDEDYYELLKHDVKVCHNDYFKPYNIIANGIPFPKGHGRLIDADALNFNADYNEPLISKFDFDCAQTIIEANKDE